jgi:hypothetical protein
VETALHPLGSAAGTLCIVRCRQFLDYESKVMSVWENWLAGGVGYLQRELVERMARKA